SLLRPPSSFVLLLRPPPSFVLLLPPPSSSLSSVPPSSSLPRHPQPAAPLPFLSAPMHPATCVRRLQRELRSVQEEGGVSPTIHLAARDGDITTLDALIFGPPDTPFDGGVFHFVIKVPPQYPMEPPEIKFMNTDGGTLRIHPQLYENGKVCLSILGTWHGPRWVATQGLRSLLLSVQSLLNEEPLRCEPGMEGCSMDAVERANVFIAHETARVLALAALAEPSWGASGSAEELTAAARAHVRSRRAPVVQRLVALAETYDGRGVETLFASLPASRSRRYGFGELARRLREELGEPLPRAPRAAEGEGSEQDGSCSSSGDEGESPCCRICHTTEEESEAPLVRPCRCSGSIALAHSDCLLAWMRHTPPKFSEGGEFRCDLCGAPLHVRLGRSEPVGLRYLNRSLDDLEGDGEREITAFDACGLAYILVLSMGQVLFSALAGVMAETLGWLAELLWWPPALVLPERHPALTK
ncbi:unnamed protein product, partial [Prorocentrum cordatum]